MTAQTADLPPTPADTLPQFLKLLLIGMLKRLPLKLLLAGGITLLAWIIHTYLLVVTNEGFNAGNSVWLDRILALQGQSLQGALVWTLAAGLVTSTIARILAYGLNSTMRSIAETPRHIWNWANELTILAIPFLIVGYLSAIFLGFFITNNLLVIQIWLVVLGILIARHTSVLLTVLRLGWSDAQRMAKRPNPIPFNLAWPGMYFTGLLVGLLAILPNGGIWPYLCGCLGFLLVILASVGLFLRSQGGTEKLVGKKILFWIIPPAFFLLFMAAAPAFADDGGWQESGGTLGGWLNSPGAFRAVVMGILPAGGAGLGVLFGTALGSMVSIFGATGVPSAVSSIKPSAPTSAVKGTAPSTASRTADHQVEGFQQQEQLSTDPSATSSGQPDTPLESRTADYQVERLEQNRLESQQPETKMGQFDKSSDAPLESRTADHQASQFQQQNQGDADGLASRHQGDDAPSAAGQMSSERARENFQVEQSRTGEGAVDPGSGQRDLRDVDPQSSSGAGTGSGSAAESADKLAKMDQDSPGGQLSDQQQPQFGGPAAERHDPGGMEDQGHEGKLSARHEAESDGPTAERHEAGGMDDQGREGQLAARHQQESAGPSAERHDPGGMGEQSRDQDHLAARHQQENEGPLAERHDPGGMSETDKPASLERPEHGAERHSPTSPDEGSLANRNDPLDSAGKEGGSVQARQFNAELAGPSAERVLGQDIGPDIPLPPVPILPITIGWELVVVRTPNDSGLEPQQRMPLKGRTRIGRHGAIDIKILDPKVSRQHADIEVAADNCTITDLDSSNGTFINGKRMTIPQVLQPGDAVKIGDTYFVVEQRGE